MRSRLSWACLLCLGCQLLAPLEAEEPEPGQSAERLWELGQDAMRHGHPELAAQLYKQSLNADPALTRNYVSLAAAYLELGDDSSACAHLGCYVIANPDQLLMRVHLADLLLRLERLAEARSQYERCIAHAQERDDPGTHHLVHCHTQLMGIAESAEDSYAAHLHRGIGLYHLAAQRAALPEAGDTLSIQGLLCKAAGELALARIERPDEARPSWYLHEVWSQLAQRQPALRALRDAADAAPFSYLTAAEQRGLRLACQCTHVEKPAR